MAIEKTQFTDKQLSKFWQEYLGQVTTAANNAAYVEGKNPDLFSKPRKHLPDNRIPVPLAKIAVEDMTGYAGSVGTRIVNWELTDQQDVGEAQDEQDRDDFVSTMRQIYSYNEEPIETSELYLEGNIQGSGFEILWTSTALDDLPQQMLTPEFRKVPTATVILKYSSDLKPQKEFGLHFVEQIEIINGEEKRVQIINAYWPESKDQYKRIAMASTWQYNENETEYPYKTVPIVPFRTNEASKSLFEAEKNIINAHDDLLSKSVNEIDRFNALITLMPGKITKELRDKLKEIMVLDDLSNHERWPEYLEKNLSGVTEFYANLSKKLERDFHKSVRVPDMSDENFAGNQSGIAIAFKLLGMEFKASLIDIYFNQGIIERDNLIKDVFKLADFEDVDDYKTVIITKRNLPIDEAAKAQIALQMFSLGISKERIIKFLPSSIVDDAEDEIARMDKQKPVIESGLSLEE